MSVTFTQWILSCISDSARLGAFKLASTRPTLPTADWLCKEQVGGRDRDSESLEWSGYVGYASTADIDGFQLPKLTVTALEYVVPDRSKPINQRPGLPASSLAALPDPSSRLQKGKGVRQRPPLSWSRRPPAGRGPPVNQWPNMLQRLVCWYPPASRSTWSAQAIQCASEVVIVNDDGWGLRLTDVVGHSDSSLNRRRCSRNCSRDSRGSPSHAVARRGGRCCG